MKVEWDRRSGSLVIDHTETGISLSLLQKYQQQDEDATPQDHSSPQLTEEALGAELVQVAERNLSQIQNVHGYVSHAHISPMKVRLVPRILQMNQSLMFYLCCSSSQKHFNSLFFLSFPLTFCLFLIRGVN